MIAEGEDELICDFAETYKILNYKSLPIELVATLACGLKSDSRIKMKLVDEKDVSFLRDKILIMTYDKVSWLAWSRSQDAQENKNRPESIFQTIYGTNKESDLMTFSSGEEFMAEYNKRINHGNNS